MWEFLLDLVFPKQCLGCGKWGSYICLNCQKNRIEYFFDQVCPYCERLSPFGLTHPRCTKESGLDGMFILAHYRALITKLIHEVKYQGCYAIIPEVANLIANKYHHKFTFDYLVPVPLSKKRERNRGFNQAEKLAKALANCLPSTDYRRHDNAVVNLLVRTHDTKPQFDLKFDERKENVKGAFALSSNLLTRSLTSLSFCLVDDVATTGATIFECAKVLKKAGAQNIYTITIARGG